MNESKSIFQRFDQSGVPLLLLRLMLAGVFLYMGVKKIVNPPGDFLKAIRLYHLLPESPPIYLNAAAIVLPWLEVCCGLALLLGLWVRGAGVVVALMLAVFTPAIFLRAWEIRAASGTPFFEIIFDCGCGSGPVVIWQKLLENLTLLALAVLAVLSGSRRWCLEPWLYGRRLRQIS